MGIKFNSIQHITKTFCMPQWVGNSNRSLLLKEWFGEVSVSGSEVHTWQQAYGVRKISNDEPDAKPVALNYSSHMTIDYSFIEQTVCSTAASTQSFNRNETTSGVNEVYCWRGDAIYINRGRYTVSIQDTNQKPLGHPSWFLAFGRPSYHQAVRLNFNITWNK